MSTESTQPKRSPDDGGDTPRGGQPGGGGEGPQKQGGPKQGGSNQGGGRSGGQRSGGPKGQSRSGAGGRRGEEAEAVRLRSKLLSLLKRLPDVERKVLEARMGLIDGQPMKPGEVATLMGMSIPEVKKIEVRAFERIREIGPLKGLEKFLQS